MSVSACYLPDLHSMSFEIEGVIHIYIISWHVLTADLYSRSPESLHHSHQSQEVFSEMQQ